MGKLWRVVSGACLLVAGSCCSQPELEIRWMGGRMDLGFDLAAGIDFSVEDRFDFELDFGGWARFEAAAGASLAVDLTGLQAYGRTLSVDIDDDGVREEVRLIAFADADPSRPTRVFATWAGDEYTYDDGRCHLLWWDEEQIELLSAACGSSEPALHCTRARGDETTLACDVCAASGRCAPCSSNRVATCVDQGEARLVSPPVATGGAGGSGTAGEAGAAGFEAGGAGAGGASAGGVEAGAAGALGADVGACLAEVASLTGRADACGLGPLRAASELCAQRATEVDICQVAVAGAGLFGSVCTALESDACAGVFP